MSELTTYEISSEPVLDRPLQQGASRPGCRDDRTTLRTSSTPTPRKAVVELEGWIEKYPDAAKLYNFLSMCLPAVSTTPSNSRSGSSARTTDGIPDYLFAKLNYAELCLDEGKIDEIPIIFDNKYDISLLYPRRKVFHITECTSFMWIMGWYFCQKGELDQARVYQQGTPGRSPRTIPATADLSRRLQDRGTLAGTISSMHGDDLLAAAEG